MTNKFDVVIVGAGPTGIFCAYHLIENNPSLKILLIDKGVDIQQRRCPILEHKIEKCPPPNKIREYASCYPACGITNGFGGAGAYSDGKFIIPTRESLREYGGWLTDYIEPSEVMNLIKMVDSINVKHGATNKLTDPNTNKVKEIERKAYAFGLKLLRSTIRHLGTEQNLEILKNIRHYLNDKIDVLFRTEVVNLRKRDNKIEGVYIKQKDGIGFIESDYIVLCPGRDGSEWLSEVLTGIGVKTSNNQVDIGVRVEVPDIVMQEINENLYEGKFIFNSSTGLKVRTFCSNPSGQVVIENHTGVMLANGHAYKDNNLKSNNTNFALLVSTIFSEPFNKPNEYAKSIARLANDLSNGGLIIQKYGDLIKGRRSTPKRIKEGFVEPTFKESVPGDLSFVLPYNTLKSLIEMIEVLNNICPGIASESTLLYGLEAKFYSVRAEVDNTLKTHIDNLYCGGDGSGLTRSLSQAGASGIHIAKNLLKNFQ